MIIHIKLRSVWVLLVAVGKPIVSYEVPARKAVAVPVPAGARFAISDPDGGQVGDLFVFRADDPSEYLSAAHTRAHVHRLFPLCGETFVTTRRRPILELGADTSPGVHDMLIPACDPERYAALGAPAHDSCAENLRQVLAGRGNRLDVVPQPVNVFMNIPVGTGGELSWCPARSGPGEELAFRALLDCLVVLSACPQDLAGINAGLPGPLRLALLSE